MIRNLAFILFMIWANCVMGQANVFLAKAIDNNAYSIPGDNISRYNIYELDASALHQYLLNAASDNSITIKLGTKSSFNFDLQENKIFKKGIKPKVVTENGIEAGTLSTIKCYQGQVHETGLPVALSVDNEFLSGFITEKGYTLYFEPLSYFIQGAPADYYIFYYADDYHENKSFKCLALETKEYQEQLDHKLKKQVNKPELEVLSCKEVEIAEASDKLMCTHYGSVTAVQNRITSVINNVQTNYCCNFNDYLQLKISDWFNVSCTGTDPWTNSTDAELIFYAFADWAPGYFGQSDIGELFTYRDLDGGTVGVAWVGVVCTPDGFSVIQDWTNNSDLMRVTVAHEIGHNFNCQHDAAGSPYIMAPSVNNTNNWSSLSISAVNAYLPFLDCLDACAGSNPPVADFTSNIVSGCKALTVNYTDLSSNKPTAWSWTFPGGTPAVSTTKNPVVVYNTPGNYSVSLIATNSSGSNTITKTNFISVKDKPKSDFSYIRSQGDVQFTNTSSGGIIYNWNFGDGKSSIELNPVHIYASPGTYSVTLTVNNDCGISTKTQLIEVIYIPVAKFTADTNEVCNPISISFSDSSLYNPISWIWSFPGGNPSFSNLKNPTVAYSINGEYDVSLIATNSEGSDTLIMSKFIKIRSKPLADFDYKIIKDTLSFNNQTNGAATHYFWYFGDGDSSTLALPVHIYGKPGEYQVKLMATNSCGTDTLSKTINIPSIPKASFSSDFVSGCLSLTVQFKDTSIHMPDKWLWLFPGAIPDTSTSQNPVVWYPNTGIYDVTLIVSNSAGSDTIIKKNYISVNDIPVANFSSQLNKGKVSFINSSISGTNFQWNFGDSILSNEKDPVHIYTNAGTFQVQLVVSNSCGVDTFIQEIIINLPPKASFSSNANVGCVPLSINYTDKSTGAATGRLWTFQGATPSSSIEQNPTVVYNNAGNYDVQLIATGIYGSDTLTKSNYIIVKDIPTALFSYLLQGNQYIFTNTSTGGTIYLWDFGDGTNSTEVSPVHLYLKEGLYTVILTVTNDCGTLSYTQLIDTKVSVNEIEFVEDYIIYPNPGTGVFNIQLKSRKEAEIEVKVYDILGNLIYKNAMEIKAGENTKEYILKNAAPGQYFLVLKSLSRLSVSKIIIE